VLHSCVCTSHLSDAAQASVEQPEGHTSATRPREQLKTTRVKIRLNDEAKKLILARAFDSKVE
jgi:hypothetical protein